MSSLSLLEVYRRHLSVHKLDADPEQQKLLVQLQGLFDELVRLDGHPNRFLRFWERKSSSLSSMKGVYLWGDVGRGKTLLLNLFFDHLPVNSKKRLHFHEFMRNTHALLAETGNTPDPLEKIARRYTRDAKLLYLDEFHVIDIGDAMILSELLEQLLACGAVLLMTSNSPPQQLYKNGLQRQRFLPAIALIDSKLKVIELRASRDYRLQFLNRTKLYKVPADEFAERGLEDDFKKIISGTISENVQLEINNRFISAKRMAGGVVWFDFDAICGNRRSSADYLEIARCYETVFISGIPLFEERDDLARRFINMIDTFYDRRVRLIVSASDIPGRLYRQGRLAEEFRRTASRLIEMQSPDHIARIHT